MQHVNTALLLQYTISALLMQHAIAVILQQCIIAALLMHYVIAVISLKSITVQLLREIDITIHRRYTTAAMQCSKIDLIVQFIVITNQYCFNTY